MGPVHDRPLLKMLDRARTDTCHHRHDVTHPLGVCDLGPRKVMLAHSNLGVKIPPQRKPGKGLFLQSAEGRRWSDRSSR